ncbi:hypothetical protein [Polyangium sp. 15x6]|uniref:hypothetical protein n=1 Tax=Polyangium sp. 15x6 TaxID=3042687 RepID=UPI00249C980F|nr:hypothetical protein [Polyangium sp. 15x6]MDI3287704.1 hypothetical protein [Polyangium sp. 15x6]
MDCVVTEDCPFWEFCGTWACESKTCVLHPDPAGTVPPQIEGDCKATQCDGSGQFLTTIDDTDAPPTTDCQIGTCLNGKPNLQPVPQSTLCNEDGGKVCNGKGECVECTMHSQCGKYPNFCDVPTGKCFNCFDGVKNGDETDVDCGGNHCQKCLNGKTCLIQWDCATSNCADGFCCDEPCDGLCWACNIAPDIGNCRPVTKYEEDVTPDGSQSCLHADGKTCNAGAVCDGALGSPCTASVECASNKCRDNNGDGQMECVKDAGDPCTIAAECYSFICSNGLCAP